MPYKFNLEKVSRFEFWNPSEDTKEVVVALSEVREISTKFGKQLVVDVARENGENRCLILSKAALRSGFQSLQKPIVGRKIVVAGLGRVKDKRYVRFYVDFLENAKQKGVVEE